MKPHSLLLFLATTVSAHIRSETHSNDAQSRAIVPILDAEHPEPNGDETLRPNDIFNTSISANLSPPFFLHADEQWSYNENLMHWPRALFQKRNYQCPTGTNDCSSIGKPNSCCGQGQQCMSVQNTGSGDVGCCPSGSICGSAIGTCNTAAGYSACPGSSNGGCCIPGYTCDSIGCIATGATTTSVIGSTVYVVSNSFTPTVVSTLTTTAVLSLVAASPTTTTIVSTTTVTPAIQQSTYYSTITTPTSTITLIASGSTATATTVTTVIASPAVLATTNSQSPQNSLVASTCAVGYYQCSAFVKLCCQIGVGCESSTCLTTASSTTVVSASVATVVLVLGQGVTTLTTLGSPQGFGQASTTTVSAASPRTASTSTITTTNTISSMFGMGMCATGWYSCAANDGGGCCPSGYSCAASCVATQTGIPNHVYKVAPSGTNSANRTTRSGGLLMYALAMMMMITVTLTALS